MSPAPTHQPPPPAMTRKEAVEAVKAALSHAEMHSFQDVAECVLSAIGWLASDPAPRVLVPEGGGETPPHPAEEPVSDRLCEAKATANALEAQNAILAMAEAISGCQLAHAKAWNGYSGPTSVTLAKAAMDALKAAGFKVKLKEARP